MCFNYWFAKLLSLLPLSSAVWTEYTDFLQKLSEAALEKWFFRSSGKRVNRTEIKNG